MKDLQYTKEARASLQRGVDKLANAVKVTLGPMGRNVVINQGTGYPYITKDGVTVASQVEINDQQENTGAQLLKSVALKTVELAGDGTTTATVLAQAIIQYGIELVDKGANPMLLKEGIDTAVKLVVDHIKEHSIEVDGSESVLKSVALISTNNDEYLASIISSAIQRVGKGGIVNIEDSNDRETKIKFSEGLSFERGLEYPQFVTNKQKDQAEYEDVFILLFDKKITSMKSLAPLLNSVLVAEKPILIIAEDIEDSAMRMILKNRVEQDMPIVVVKAPERGELRDAVMSDIAVLTGGTVITPDLISLEQVGLSQLGRCKRVVIDRARTTIIGGEGSPEKITELKEELSALIENAEDKIEKETYEERLAKINNGVCTILVGAATEVEMNEKKDRVEDAVFATKAAVQEGIVAGGGIAYIRAAQYLMEVEGFAHADIESGFRLLESALFSPLKQMCSNAGVEDDKVIPSVLKGDLNYGYNVRTGRFGDMIELGVIDPAKVSRVALQNAASIASMILTTECLLLNTNR
jgi:chaperonin GroEL